MGMVSSGNPEFLIPLMSGQMSLKAVQGEHYLGIAFREVPCPSVGDKRDETCRLQSCFMGSVLSFSQLGKTPDL